MELADRGAVVARPLGDSTLWITDRARFSRQSASSSTTTASTNSPKKTSV